MPRVTQKDVAIRAAVHPSTVSLVLSGRTGIPEETRQRVLEAAQALGYERDPMLGALAAYRRNQRPEQFHGVLAWIHDSTGGFNYRTAEEYRLYNDGALQRAAELGYQVEAFDLCQYESNPRRIAGVCAARGILGAFISPQPQANASVQLDLERMAAVAMGHTIHQPQLHAVSSDDYDAMRTIVQQLRQLGYERIGYAVPESYNERVRRQPLAAFLAEQPIADPALIYRGAPEPAPFSAWIAGARPDALITTRYGFPRLLHELGIGIPERMGVALVSLGVEPTPFAGIDEFSFVIGQAAAELLTSLVERGQFGVPHHPQRVVIKGAWRSGASVRQSGAEAGRASQNL